MFANLTKFGQSAAQKAAKLAESVGQLSKIQAEYDIAAEVGYAGPRGVWKIHRARPRRGADGSLKAVSVWIASKKQFQDQLSSTGRSAASIIERDAKQTNLLKHPGVVRIIEPLEETRKEFLLVTEEVLGSLDSWLNGHCKFQQEVNDEPLSELEIKYGLDRIVEGLAFLHGSCKLVHCSLSPMSIVIAADGQWKLSGLGLSQPLSSPDSLVGLTTQNKQTYSYDYDMTAVVDSMARPDLQFTAPELISSVSDAPVSGATDVFSLACIIYRVLRKQSLFTAQTTPEYRSMLSSMHLIPVDGLPPTLQGVMRGMLTQDAASRPAVKAVVEAGYFKDDRMLRALRFIDTILQRETAQKHAFVRDLPTFLPQFPIRILRLRVLPCLIQQWHDSALRDAVLPLVLRMVKNLPADIFQEQVLPELKGILASASGPQVTQVLHAVPDLQQAMRADQVEDVLMPVMLKALGEGDTRLQEEVLQTLKVPMAKISSACIHNKVLPQLLKACVNTKSASVRMAVLEVVAALAPRLTEKESDVVGRMIKHLTGIDSSDATLSGVMDVCEAVSSSKSSAYTMRVLVPLVSPLMVISAMQPKTFAKYMAFMRGALSRCEERAVSTSHQPNNGSSNGAATWDEPGQSGAAAPASVQVEGSLNATSGLGLGGGDMLSDWSFSVAATRPDLPAASQAKSGGSGTNQNGMGLPQAKPLFQPSTNAGAVPVRVAGSTAASRSSSPGGAIGGGISMSAAMGKPHATPATLAAAPLFPGTVGGNGKSATRMNGMNAQFSGMSVSGPSGDPFADLLGGPVAAGIPRSPHDKLGKTATGSLLDVSQPKQWDPFA